MTRYNKFAFLIIIGLAVVLVWQLRSDKENNVALNGQPYQASVVNSAPIIANTPVVNRVALSADLYFGLRDNEAVKNLQQFLKDNNFYIGPITGNFYSLTLSAVKKFQKANSISPAVGFVGAKTRAVINAITLKNKINEPVLATQEIIKTVEQPRAEPIVVPVVTAKQVETLKSALKFLITFPALSLSKYRDVILNEFKLVDDLSSNKTAVKKIRFKNAGTLPFGYMVLVQLLNSNTGVVLASAQEQSDGTIEFILTPDSNLSDKGLMVTGGLYSIVATLITPNSAVKPYIQLSIDSASDVVAVDFNNLAQIAILDSNNFPVVGPRITLP